MIQSGDSQNRIGLPKAWALSIAAITLLLSSRVNDPFPFQCDKFEKSVLNRAIRFNCSLVYTWFRSPSKLIDAGYFENLSAAGT